MTNSEDFRVVHLDSVRLRALAHPLRWRLLSVLRLYGEDTATGLARRLDTNSGATSYHLRKLAEVGLVMEVEGRGVRRERWWRAAHDMTSWTETDFSNDPDDRAATDWITAQLSEARSRLANDWLVTRHEWSDEWRDASNTADHQLWLDPEGLAALNNDLHEVIQRHLEATDDPPEDDAERVIVLLDTFPCPEPRWW